MRSLLAGGVLLFALGGCGSSSDEGDPAPPWEPGQACPKDRVALAGQLDSSPVEVTVKHGGYEFNQGVDPKTLWIVISDGKLDMTWTELLPYGKTGAATGALLVPSLLPHGGETLCAGSAQITPLEHQFVFTLTDLAACTGGAALGTIQGCLETL